jgi:hypothetical protein
MTQVVEPTNLDSPLKLMQGDAMTEQPVTTARSTTPSSSWNRIASWAVRRWVAIPLLLSFLMASIGVALGYTAKPSAEALLLVQADATDTAAAESMALELNTLGFFTTVTRGTGKAPKDLQARTRIAAKPNSRILSIVVSAPSSEQAAVDANAIANEALASEPNRARAALDQLTEETGGAIRSRRLTSPDAERARVVQLGEELGASQAALLTSGNQLHLLQSAEPVRRLPAAPVLGLMGGLAGALLGIGVALLLGRRGTVKSERELTELYPQTAVIDTADIKNVITTNPDTSTVILAATRGVDVAAVAEIVRQGLTNGTGRDVVIVEKLADVPVAGPRSALPRPESTDPPAAPEEFPAWPLLPGAGGLHDNEGANGHVTLVPTTLSESVVRRASQDGRSVMLVPVRPGVTKLEALDNFASRIPDRTYLLVQ